MLENFQFYVYLSIFSSIGLLLFQISNDLSKKLFLLIVSITFLYSVSSATLVITFVYLALCSCSLLFKANKKFFIIKFLLIVLTAFLFIYGSTFKLIGDLVSIFGISYSFIRSYWLVNYIQKEKIIFSNFVDILLYFFYFPSFTIGPIEKPDLFIRAEIYQSWYLSINGLARLALGIVFLFGIQPIISNLESIEFIPFLIRPILSLLILFFNFSGYTHVAIGSSMLLGIKLTENFNAPWLAEDLSDFWKRWHISLMNFANENIFFPLFKLFKGAQKRSIFTTFIFLGFWHGLSSSFFLWGLSHGLFLPFSVSLRKNMNKIKYLPKFLKTFINRFMVIYFVSIVWYFSINSLK